MGLDQDLGRGLGKGLEGGIYRPHLGVYGLEIGGLETLPCQQPRYQFLQ
jgi:hypothetical protein